MQHQRGLKLRSLARPMSGPLSRPAAPPSTAPEEAPRLPLHERATAKWPIGVRGRPSERWEVADPDDGRRTDPGGTAWDETEAITARRSAPRLEMRSLPWESVHPDELISSIPPPPTARSSGDEAFRAQAAVSFVPAKAASFGPVSVEANDDEPVDFRRGVFPLRSTLIAMAVVAVTAMAIVARSGGLHRLAARMPAASPVPAQMPEDTGVAPPTAPLMAATGPEPSPPRETGTITGSPDHRLYIDGHAATTWKVEVKCGKHLAKNGSRGVEHVVEVPCGGDVEVPASPR